MNSVTLTEIVRRFCEGFLKLVYLNVLWFLFSVVGLGLFGIIPATVALCMVQRKWLKEKHVKSIFAEYWKYYKKHFVKSNILAVILVLLGGIIYFDLKFFMEQEGILSQVISIIIFILSVWFMITILYILPIYVTYQLRLLGYIKYAFIIAMLNPFKTLGMAISTWGMVYLSLYFPQILFSIGISLTFFIIMIISLQAMDHVSLLQQKFAKVSG